MPDTEKSPSFFIIPDEKRNYSPHIKLGNIIYNLKKPQDVLFRPDTASVSALEAPQTLKNYRHEKGENRTVKVGLFAKILAFFGLGGEISHTSDADGSETYEIKSMTIERPAPTPEFRAALKAESKIMKILRDGNPACAYLITGIVKATGVVFKSTAVRDGANEGSLGVNVQGAPLGFSARRSKKRTLKVDWETEDEMVLAFELQKLQLNDDEVTAEEYTDGAYMGDDDETREEDVEFNADFGKRELRGLQVDAGEDDLTGGEFKLYLPEE